MEQITWEKRAERKPSTKKNEIWNNVSEKMTNDNSMTKANWIKRCKSFEHKTTNKK